MAAAQRNENTPTAITAAKVDAVKSDVHKAGEAVETTGAQLMETGAQLIETAAPPDRGEPRDTQGVAEAPNGGSKPNAHASPTNNGDAPPLIAQIRRAHLLTPVTPSTPIPSSSL